MGRIDFKELLSGSRYNSRGDHIISDCPFCSKDGHFYINIAKALVKRGRTYVNAWDCKKCGEVGNIVKLLTKLNKLTILEDGSYSDLQKRLNNILFSEDPVNSTSLEVPEMKMPIGFKRSNSDPYLDVRGFTKFEYEKYIVGRTNIKVGLRDYVMMAVEESRKIKGYLGRSTLSKLQIDEINSKYKREGAKRKHVRYKNSMNTEFNKLLLGYDEIMFYTDWVILVEGYFDKIRVDQVLGLDNEREMKSCATFGKAISIEQIRKLQKRGVTNVILIQDPDALDNAKHQGLVLQNEFEKVLLGFTKDKDLGDSNSDDISKVFNRLKPPIEFGLSYVNYKKLSYQ